VRRKEAFVSHLYGGIEGPASQERQKKRKQARIKKRGKEKNFHRKKFPKKGPMRILRERGGTRIKLKVGPSFKNLKEVIFAGNL